MRTETVYVCEVCGEEFPSALVCQSHEDYCRSMLSEGLLEIAGESVEQTRARVFGKGGP